MSYWNYRVVEKNTTNKIDCSNTEYDTTVYEVHEVYYDEDDNITMWSAEPIAGYGEGDYRDLKADLEYMLEACSKPILKESDLPDSGEYFSGVLHSNGLLKENGL